MNVSLTPQLEDFVADAVKSGRYGSASEAVREGLRLLEEREARFKRLKRDIDEGLASGSAQEGTFAEMAREFRAEWEAERATNEGARKLALSSHSLGPSPQARSARRWGEQPSS